jgi:hypothetical protein
MVKGCFGIIYYVEYKRSGNLCDSIRTSKRENLGNYLNDYSII